MKSQEPRFLRDYSKMSPADFVEFGENVIASLTGNKNFEALPPFLPPVH